MLSLERAVVAPPTLLLSLTMITQGRVHKMADGPRQLFDGCCHKCTAVSLTRNFHGAAPPLLEMLPAAPGSSTDGCGDRGFIARDDQVARPTTRRGSAMFVHESVSCAALRTTP